MQKLFVCMALVCLAVLPALNARPHDGAERELMEMAIQALEAGQAQSVMEQMVMQSGTYGAGTMVGGYGGQAGGILTDSDSASSTPTEATTPTSELESGESNKPSTAATPAPKPVPTTTTTNAKSAALPAHQSAGLVAAGVMVALSVFLL